MLRSQRPTASGICLSLALVAPLGARGRGIEGGRLCWSSKNNECGFAVARKKSLIDRCVVIRGKESHGALREGVRMDRGWRVGQFNDPSKSTGLADGESWKRAVPRGWLAWASSFIDGRAGRAGSPCQPALACTSSMLSDGKLPLGTENAPRTSKLRLRLRMSLRTQPHTTSSQHSPNNVRSRSDHNLRRPKQKQQGGQQPIT